MRILILLQACWMLFHDTLSQSNQKYYRPAKNFLQDSGNSSNTPKTVSDGRTTGNSTIILSSNVKNKAYIHEIVYTTSGSCVINPGGSYSPCLSTQSNTIITFSVCILSIPAKSKQHDWIHGSGSHRDVSWAFSTSISVRHFRKLFLERDFSHRSIRSNCEVPPVSRQWTRAFRRVPHDL